MPNARHGRLLAGATTTASPRARLKQQARGKAAQRSIVAVTEWKSSVDVDELMRVIVGKDTNSVSHSPILDLSVSPPGSR